MAMPPWADLLSSLNAFFSFTVVPPLPSWAFEVDCRVAAEEVVLFEEPNTELLINSTDIGRGTLKLTTQHLCWTRSGTTYSFELRNLAALGRLAGVRPLIYCEVLIQHGEHKEANFSLTLAPSNDAAGMAMHSAIDDAMLRVITMPGEGLLALYIMIFNTYVPDHALLHLLLS